MFPKNKGGGGVFFKNQLSGFLCVLSTFFILLLELAILKVVLQKDGEDQLDRSCEK